MHVTGVDQSQVHVEGPIQSNVYRELSILNSLDVWGRKHTSDLPKITRGTQIVGAKNAQSTVVCVATCMEAYNKLANVFFTSLTDKTNRIDELSGVLEFSHN